MLRGAAGFFMDWAISLKSWGGYFGGSGMVAAALVPALESGDPAKPLPLPVDALTVLEPALATQIFPEPSIAMLSGEFRPLPVKTLSVVPAEFSRVTLLLAEFATQALPPLSMAMAEGALKPPAMKPLEPESAAPVGSSLVTLELPWLLTHTAPVASVAMELGVLRPPPM